MYVECEQRKFTLCSLLFFSFVPFFSSFINFWSFFLDESLAISGAPSESSLCILVIFFNVPSDCSASLLDSQRKSTDVNVLHKKLLHHQLHHVKIEVYI